MEFKKVENSQNFWNPEKENEELIGKVTKIKTDGDFGKQYEITDDKEVKTLTPAHKWLQNLMSEVKEGMTVKIVYIGEELPKVKGNNPTKKYDVYIAE